MQAGVDVGRAAALFVDVDWRREDVVLFVVFDDGQLFAEGGAFVVKAAVLVVGAAGTVEGVDIFAVVLDARAVDVYGGLADFADGFAEQAVTPLRLALRKGRAGNVDEQVDIVRIA